MPTKAAWRAILDSLPAHWRVGPPSRDPGADGWSVTARGEPPVAVIGFGKDEIAALRDLDERLRDVRHPDGSCGDQLVRKSRTAYARDAGEADETIPPADPQMSDS